MAAEEILRFALFKEVVKHDRRKKRKLNTGRARRQGSGGSDSDEDDETDDEEDDDEGDLVDAQTEARDQRAAEREKRMQSRTSAPPTPARSTPSAPPQDSNQETVVANGDTGAVDGQQDQAVGGEEMQVDSLVTAPTTVVPAR